MISSRHIVLGKEHSLHDTCKRRRRRRRRLWGRFGEDTIADGTPCSRFLGLCWWRCWENVLFDCTTRPPRGLVFIRGDRSKKGWQPPWCFRTINIILLLKLITDLPIRLVKLRRFQWLSCQWRHYHHHHHHHHRRVRLLLLLACFQIQHYVAFSLSSTTGKYDQSKSQMITLNNQTRR
jgi:hypothetical protein